MTRYTIDELAQRSGVTSRNIRTYQEHGLLRSPTITGRVGYYDDGHMARLALIRSLQDRGFSRAAIRDLLVGWESGYSIADVIGVEQALTTDWDVDEGFVTDAELDAVFGDDPAPRKRAVELGLLRPAEGGGYVVSSQRVFDAGVQLLGLGVPIGTILDVAEQLLDHAQQIAADFRQLFEDHVMSSIDPASPGSKAATVAAVEALRPLPGSIAGRAIELTLSRALREMLVDLVEREGRSTAVQGRDA